MLRMVFPLPEPGRLPAGEADTHAGKGESMQRRLDGAVFAAQLSLGVAVLQAKRGNR